MFFKLLIVLFTLFGISNAQMFQTVEKEQAKIVQEGVAKPFCPNCGMHLQKYYKTNHIIDNKQYCSIHCVVDSKSNISNSVEVIDAKSAKIIDAKKAHYIVGSKISGTMTQNSKYAFANIDDAKEFQKNNGGQIKSFEQSYKIAQDDMTNDNKVLSKKREKMAMMGENIYKTLCNINISIPKFNSIGDAKKFVIENSLCSNIDAKKTQAVSIYLFNKNNSSKSIFLDDLEAPKDAKCPVCGMFVSKYPKWAASVKTGNHIHYFDGVKDLMKFYFHPHKFGHTHAINEFSNFEVIEYFNLKTIDGTKAWYVYNSKVYGPMGNELIPFITKNEAITFIKTYGGEVVYFDDISENIVGDLDR